jgi:hypothetical protein
MDVEVKYSTTTTFTGKRKALFINVFVTNYLLKEKEI